MTDDREHARKAAMAISDLLTTILTKDPRPDEMLYAWERDAFDWLVEQRRRDPGTSLCLWAADRMRAYADWKAGLDLDEPDGVAPT